MATQLCFVAMVTSPKGIISLCFYYKQILHVCFVTALFFPLCENSVGRKKCKNWLALICFSCNTSQDLIWNCDLNVFVCWEIMVHENKNQKRDIFGP